MAPIVVITEPTLCDYLDRYGYVAVDAKITLASMREFAMLIECLTEEYSTDDLVITENETNTEVHISITEQVYEPLA